MQLDPIFSIAILIVSVIIHEVSHGYAALYLGDSTAQYAGRLSLNPVKHLDPIGSIIVPFVLSLIPPHIVFGWAKPVPVNPYNLRDQRWGEVLVAAAGPLSNLVIALIFGLLIRFNSADPFLSAPFLHIAAMLVLINLLLAVFNLVPIPPLDGSKIFFGLLPERFYAFKEWFTRNYLMVFLFFVFFVWQFVNPLVFFLFRLVTGA
ncbi:MAG: site-2 protease family protein [Candidatus Taylorbacteria bacterium]|nr:site-2 protease family protein [Candidatus Taylorbacteria bacterium]